jgi:hypothetical protein
MVEFSSIALLPGNTDHKHAEQAAHVIAATTREDLAAAIRRIWSTRFVVERIPQVQAVDIMGRLIEQHVGVVAVPSRGVLPLPRRTLITGIALNGLEFKLQLSQGSAILHIKDFLHAHVGRLRIRGSRRILTRAGREMQIETDITILDLYFRGGAAYRLDLNKVSFELDPVLRNLARSDAAATFLWELARRAQDVRRPIVPATLPLIEGLSSPFWVAAKVPNLKVFDHWGRWWFALAANSHLPSPERLDEILVSTTPIAPKKPLPPTRLMSRDAVAHAATAPPPSTPSAGTRIPKAVGPASRPALQSPATIRLQADAQTAGRLPPIAPQELLAPPVIAPPGSQQNYQSAGSSPVNIQDGMIYESFMHEAAELETQGQFEQACQKYRQAIGARDTFEARLALVETLVDSQPFDAWFVCEETVQLHPIEAERLVNEYKGIHQENYDCHDFLTYRAFRRFLRKREIDQIKGYDPIRRFFSFHELSNKLPDATKGGLLDAYGDEMHFEFPLAHRQLISSYNGLDLFNRAFRFLGVGSEDEAFDLFLFNDPDGWRSFYGPVLEGFVGFGFDYLGNVFLYDARKLTEEPSVVRLDVDTGELEPVATNFLEFIGVDLTDRDEDVVRSRLLREWQKRKSQLKMRECLSFQTSPVLGGERNFSNLTTSELSIRLHMAGQVATQAQQIPEGATIHGVRVINQEELLLKVYWDY